jgi:hypothetical protein
MQRLKHWPAWRKYLVLLLAWIGAGAVVLATGAGGVRLLRNHAPDSLVEQISPDRHYRIVVLEEMAGSLGSQCVKQVYVLEADKTLDRNDADNRVYAGACDGLRDIEWTGSGVYGTVSPGKAVEGVNSLVLKPDGANGRVRVKWNTD